MTMREIEMSAHDIQKYIQGFESALLAINIGSSQTTKGKMVLALTGYESATMDHYGKENFIRKGLESLWKMVSDFFKKVWGWFFGTGKKAQENDKKIKSDIKDSNVDDKQKEKLKKVAEKAPNIFTDKQRTATVTAPHDLCYTEEEVKKGGKITEDINEILTTLWFENMANVLTMKVPGTYAGADNIVIEENITLANLKKFIDKYSSFSLDVAGALAKLQKLEPKLKPELEKTDLSEKEITTLANKAVKFTKEIGSLLNKTVKFQDEILKVLEANKEKENNKA